MKIEQNAAKAISKLINTITVSLTMEASSADKEERDLWREDYHGAVVELADRFGIEQPGLEHSRVRLVSRARTTAAS